jgi:hypothetical protein
MATNSEFVDVIEVAKRLDVSVSFLNKARVFGGGPPYVKIGRSVRYDWVVTREWARARTRNSTSENTRESAARTTVAEECAQREREAVALAGSF